MVQLEEGPEAGIHGTMKVLQSSPADALENALGTTAEKPRRSETWNWDDDPSNPYNWPTRQKVLQVVMIGWAGFTTLVLPPAQCRLLAS